MSGKACEQCRKGKRRCEAWNGPLPCFSCNHRRLPCSRVPIESSSAAATESPTSAISSLHLTQENIPKRVIETLVDLYLRYMHDKPHALFHEPSLKIAVASGSVSQVVLLSILGLAARYGLCFLATHYGDEEISSCQIKLQS